MVSIRVCSRAEVKCVADRQRQKMIGLYLAREIKNQKNFCRLALKKSITNPLKSWEHDKILTKEPSERCGKSHT